jgi:hypothetical protein
MAGLISGVQNNRVSLTQSMRQEYGRMNMEAQAEGNTMGKWEEWVRSQGYDFDKNGLVVPPPTTATK